jgi:hypothetical protein
MTLADDGVAYPDLSGVALLVWFKTRHPGSDKTAIAGSSASQHCCRELQAAALARRSDGRLSVMPCAPKEIAGHQPATLNARAAVTVTQADIRAALAMAKRGRWHGR